MGERPPVLDNRTLEDIINQLAVKAKSTFGEWENDPAGNPGAMLQMIFARFMELAVERLNKVPYKTFLAFLNAMGISLLPPRPSGAALTFKPIEGAGCVLVPKYSQVALSASETPVIFETEENLTVVPGEITDLRVVDPVNGRYANLKEFLEDGGDNCFNPFLGKKILWDELYFGYENALNFSKVDVKLYLSGSDSNLRALSKMQWEDSSGGIILPSIVEKGPDRIGEKLLLMKNPDPINITEIKDSADNLGLLPEIRSWCLKVRRPSKGQRINKKGYTFSDIRLSTEHQGDILPDALMAGVIPVELNDSSFQPFGDLPKEGSLFYMAFDEAFSKAGQGDFYTELEFCVNQPDAVNHPTSIEWQYYKGDGQWETIKQVNNPFDFHKECEAVYDSANLFTAPHTNSTVTIEIKLQHAITPVEINGMKHYWIRIKVTNGDFGEPYRCELKNPADLNEGYKIMTGKVSAPVIHSIKMTRYTLTTAPVIMGKYGFYTCKVNNTLFNKTLIPHMYRNDRPAFYIGFDDIFPEQPVTVYTATEPNVYTNQPESDKAAKDSGQLIEWEYFNGDAWHRLAVIDGTRQFVESGTFKFMMPEDSTAVNLFGDKCCHYIRVRLMVGDPLDLQFRVKGVYLNTVPAIQAETLTDQILGSSNGMPDFRCSFSRTPVLPSQKVFVLESEIPPEKELARLKEEGSDVLQIRTNTITGKKEVWVCWHEVSGFYMSESYSRHYLLDRSTGEIIFGDGVRGMIPPRGINNLMSTYRITSGVKGNTKEHTITKLVSLLPKVQSVYNPVLADGGADGETMDMVMERGPQSLKNYGRAVAKEDYEWLVCEAVGLRAARVKCLPNTNRNLQYEPGCVSLIIVPSENVKRPVPRTEFIKKIEDYLRSCAFAGIADMGTDKLNIIGPGYIQVDIEVEVIPKNMDEAQIVKNRVTSALNKFIHPLTGGPLGQGWVFGRNVFASELCGMMEGIEGVDHIDFNSLKIVPNSIQKKITLKMPQSIPQILQSGCTLIFKSSGSTRKKSMILAELSVSACSLNAMVIGFKEGDKILLRDCKYPMTIKSVSYNSDHDLILGVEPFDFEVQWEEGTKISTFDESVVCTLKETVIQNGKVVALLLDEVKTGDSLVEVRNRNQDILLSGQDMEVVEVTNDYSTAFLDENYLVYSGVHRVHIKKN